MTTIYQVIEKLFKEKLFCYAVILGGAYLLIEALSGLSFFVSGFAYSSSYYSIGDMFLSFIWIPIDILIGVGVAVLGLRLLGIEIIKQLTNEKLLGYFVILIGVFFFNAGLYSINFSFGALEFMLIALIDFLIGFVLVFLGLKMSKIIDQSIELSQIKDKLEQKLNPKGNDSLDPQAS